MILIAIKTTISFILCARSSPCMAFCDSLINTINKGMITGKLKMAISVLLLPAFDVMPDTIVKTEAKLMLPRITVKKYKEGSPKGFRKIMEYVTNAIIAKNAIKHML